MKIIIIIMTLSLISCKNDTSKLKVEYEVNKELDSLSHRVFSVFDLNYQGVGNTKKVYQSKDSLYFFTLSGMQQKLEIVNLSSKKINPEIGFYESDELLREQFNFDDFYIHNLDSIFLFSSNNYKLVLINSKGSLEKIWDINQETANSQNDNFLHITTTGSSSFFYDTITKKMFSDHILLIILI